MDRAACERFLEEYAPRLGLRWAGYRRVSGQVCKRLGRRMQELGAATTDAYAQYLAEHPDEWHALEALCRVTVSRFYRDAAVFDCLRDEVLPALAKTAAAEHRPLKAWSAGCASGEEPYSLAITWKLAVASSFPAVELRVTATDANPDVLERARGARYQFGSLKELPKAWRAAGLSRDGVVHDDIRALVHFEEQDLRHQWPADVFDLVLCRNVVCTYLVEAEQRRVFAEILARLRVGGVLVVGLEERMTPDVPGLAPLVGALNIFRRT